MRTVTSALHRTTALTRSSMARIYHRGTTITHEDDPVCACGKLIFITRNEAKAFAKRAQTGTPQTPYRCSAGNCHLTHYGRGAYKQLKRQKR